MEPLAPTRISRLLAALGERLTLAGEPVELVVIGGFGLNLLGFVDRATRDVDVVALMANAELRPASASRTGG